MRSGIMPNIKEQIQETLKKNKNIPPEEYELHEAALTNIFENGMTPREALGFNQEFLNKVYSFAYTLYQTRKTEEAAELFKWLRAMDPNEEKYTIALMHCFIDQKKWIGATTLQLELAFQNPDDPYPFAKMCDCLLEAGDLSGAMIAVHAAVLRAGDNPKLAQDKEKWQLTYDYIATQLNDTSENSKVT